VRKPARDAPDVVQPGRADTYVLDVEDAVPCAREAAGNFLVTLPVELPLDAGDQNDVASTQHKGLHARPAGTSSALRKDVCHWLTRLLQPGARPPRGYW